MKTQILTKNGLDIYTEEIKEYIKNRDIVATTSPELKNSYDSWLKINDFYGESKQETTTGKNKLPFPYYSALPYTTYGVTFTDIKNGAVNVNGTSTGDAFIDLYRSNVIMLTTEPVIFSKGESGNVALLYFECIEGEWIQKVSSLSTEIAITPSADATGQIFRIALRNGYTANNEKCYPMIRLASNADSTWEKYTGGKASPSSDYPQPIESTVVNRIDVMRKNICGELIEGKVIDYLSGTAVSNTNYACTDFVRVQKDESYVIHYAFGSAENWFYDISKNAIKPIPATTDGNIKYFTADADGYIRCSLQISNKNLFMIEHGTVATEYEPYQSQTVNLSEPIELNGIGGVRDTDKLKKFAKITANELSTFRSDFSVGAIFLDNNIAILTDWTIPYQNMLCNIFSNVYSRTELLTNTSLSGIALATNDNGNCTIFFRITDIEQTKEAYNAYLSKTPLEVIFERAEPIETALPQADIDALNNLRTYNGTTIITTDSNLLPTINLEYSTSTLGSYVLDSYHQFLFNKSEIKLLDDSNYEPLE